MQDFPDKHENPQRDKPHALSGAHTKRSPAPRRSSGEAGLRRVDAVMSPLMARPANRDLRGYAGDDYVVGLVVEDRATDDPVSWAPRNLTGYTFKGDLKVDRTGEVVESFSFDMSDAASGAVLCVLDHIKMTGLGDVNEKKYVYDIQSTSPSGIVETWIYGIFTVDPEVTK